MIPTMLLFGLVFGRWWRVCLPAAAVVWPAILLVDGTMGVELGLLAAAGLGVVNAAAGTLVHQGGLRVVRFLRRRQDAAVPSG
ncbi:MAG: hypothetical protein ACODAF_03445 [Actinomycetota bacterium]